MKVAVASEKANPTVEKTGDEASGSARQGGDHDKKGTESQSHVILLENLCNELRPKVPVKDEGLESS